MIRRTILLSFNVLAVLSCSQEQERTAGCFNSGTYPQVINIRSRETVSLNGVWKSIIDPYENGDVSVHNGMKPIEETFYVDKDYFQDKTKLVEYSFETSDSLSVPGDWNTQRPELSYYEGAMWYRRKFDVDVCGGKRYFLYFGAANYHTTVALNGELLGSHEGGYTPFLFELTGKLHPAGNSLVVKVNNKRVTEGIPANNTDWWNYGGLTRDVCIIKTPQTFIRDYFLHLPKGEYGRVEGELTIDGPQSAGARVKLEIPELGLCVHLEADQSGRACFSAEAHPQLWTPECPKLYEVHLTCGEDSISDQIGFRNIETRGTELLLNGEKIFCRGVAVHEEKLGPDGGRANSPEECEALLSIAKDLGCNFVRLAHYPHNENMVRAAERMGIMVWSEIPVYWAIDWDNPATYSNAEAQLTDMIVRDRNRANVIIWSIGNETPNGDSRLRFLSSLADKSRELDPTRLVSAAMLKTKVNDTTYMVKDNLIAKLDVIGFNEYTGWYYVDIDMVPNLNWKFEYAKPVIITEFGGGCRAGYHGLDSEMFTEEYFAKLYSNNLVMIENIEPLAGTCPWILKDFKSPKRQLKGIHDCYNRKGLVSNDGVKKSAFYIMKDWYSTK